MMTLLSFALALFVTSVTLPPLRKHAARLGLVDAPTETRKIHKESIPHSGGVAIVLGVLVAAISWLPKDVTLLPLLGCIIIIILLGLLDDLRDLDYRIKFAGQALATAALLLSYGGFSNLPFAPLASELDWLTLGFSFVFILAVTNAVNLSDGLDGLAAGNGLLSLIFLAVIAAQAGERAYLVLTLSMAGGLIGFLRFNSHPASIFMGDTGSLFIGFAASALCILIMQSDQLPFSPMISILIFGLSLLDTMSVMMVRKWRGRPLFSADRSHLHHQLLRLGFLHYEVVALLYLLQAICIGMAYTLRYASDLAVLTAYLTFCGLTLGPILAGRLRGWRVRAKTSQGNVERRNLFFRQLSWYHTNTARVLAPAISAFILYHCWQTDYPPWEERHWAWLVVAALIGLWVFFHNNLPVVARIICLVACPLSVYGALFSQTESTQPLLFSDLYLLAMALALALAIRVTRRSLFQIGSQDYLILLIVAIAPMLLPKDIDGLPATRLVGYLAVLLYGCEYIITKGKRTRWILSATGIASIAAIAV